MSKLEDDVLAAVGRMTVAAMEVERSLADVAAVGHDELARPGEALRAARAVVRDERAAALVEAAATQLARARLVVLGLSRGEVEAAAFDDVIWMLVRCRDQLDDLAGETLPAGRRA